MNWAAYTKFAQETVAREKVVIDKLGGELTLMRKDLDQVVVKIDGLRNDLSGRVAVTVAPPKVGG